MNNLKKKIWWSYLDDDLRELLMQSQLLIDTVTKWEESDTKQFHDYSFIVFPAAKAYEGYLKNVFKDLRFITSEDFYGKRFRIGKALNPTLEKTYRKKESVYDRLVDFCGGKELADEMWRTWRECRNVLFHWFPNERNVIDFAEAKEKVDLIMNTMDLVFQDCKLENDK